MRFHSNKNEIERSYANSEYSKSNYDFIDFGCKKGRSIIYCMHKFGVKSGIGIDLKYENVRETKKAGFEVIRGDIRFLPLKEKCVTFVSMLDFLEHLQSKSDVEQVLKQSKAIARDFLFIRHPSFEDAAYLSSLGLKISWTDWHGHPTHLTLTDYREILSNLGLKMSKVVPLDRIKYSNNKHVIPLGAAQDTVVYKKCLGPKPDIKFNKPVYSKFYIYVRLRDDVDIKERKELVTKILWLLTYVKVKTILSLKKLTMQSY